MSDGRSPTESADTTHSRNIPRNAKATAQMESAVPFRASYGSCAPLGLISARASRMIPAARAKSKHMPLSGPAMACRTLGPLSASLSRSREGGEMKRVSRFIPGR